MASKLVLGTAQFGMNYGINNKQRRLPDDQIFRILEFALDNGLDTLDTAYDYGNSENTIGKFMEQHKVNFKVISKLSWQKQLPPESIINASLERLHLDKIYAYLIHDFNHFLNAPEAWGTLRKFKEDGKIEKIGFSLYYPSEIEYLLQKNIQIDLLQIPYSILDQRFAGWLPVLEERNIEVHARSIFLQGLIFIKPPELKSKFVKLAPKLTTLRMLSEGEGIPLSAMCICFPALNNYIKNIVVGVDSFANLCDNLNAFSYQKQVMKISDKLLNLREDDEGVILPINWGH